MKTSIVSDSSIEKGAALDRVLATQIPPEWEKFVKSILVISTVLLILAAGWMGVLQRLFRIIPDASLGNLWIWTLAVYGLIHYAALIWRIWLWSGYRPMATVEESKLPMVTVVIPAYNEGSLVQDSIRSVTHSHYPPERLQVIVVDDGSTDDTWEHIQNAASKAPIPVKIIRQPRNMGKRHALFAGFQQASGDLWVTVDSDSILHPDALRNGVSPLLRDQRIGLVAGCVKVLNRNDSLITRFLKVQFVLSFTFSRAYQSQIRGLLTTPGALSIYRASAVKPVLEKWLHQTFLGVPCLTGEDRSMTNLITAQGFHSFFQSNAVVWAQMPSRYMGMAKMYLRWARSNIRETVILISFLFTPFRKDYVWGFRINSVLITTTLIVPYFLIFNSYYLLFTSPSWLFKHAVIVAVFSIPMAAIYYRSERDSDFAWVIAYEFFWVLACQWIMPYAFLTCRQQGAWITRESREKISFREQTLQPPLVSDFQRLASCSEWSWGTAEDLRKDKFGLDDCSFPLNAGGIYLFHPDGCRLKRRPEKDGGAEKSAFDIEWFAR
ncbi:MAG TPA: glycosyltransferase [Syntrophales bacterium]|nr:glycosyltransferase [Syntrophales bacterium]HPI57271.1 glycosyltransferase [Syntrophales bacterium]HPN25151.1 glycosyltransferase [Syntrophales bacterium]HQM29429.1 glycosyltransferase [Syntrophales bacterium]